MTPRSAKSKGRNFQQMIRDKILTTFPELEADDVRSTAMGQNGEDIQLSPAARKLLPFQIECKSKKTSQIHTYYDQAKEHGGHEPLVFVKMDRKETLAILEADKFLQMVKELQNYKKGVA